MKERRQEARTWPERKSEGEATGVARLAGLRRFGWTICRVVGLLCVVPAFSGGEELREKIIFDTDSAVFNDDGAALTMLLHHRDRFEILGVTVVAGNHPAAQGAEHLLHVMELLEVDEVPLYIGAQAPLVNSADRARLQAALWGKISFMGAFAAAPGVKPPFGGVYAAQRPEKDTAVSFIIRTIEKYPGQVTILAIGPLTNIAMVLRLRPDLASAIKHLVFMGGNARVGGNVTPFAEFNFWFDPEAARAVLHSDIPRKTMFGLDITNHAVITRHHFEQIAAVDTPICRLFAHDMGNNWPGFYANPDATGYVWDCLAAGYLIDPTFVTASEVASIEVNTTFGPAYGGCFVRADDPVTGKNRVEVMLDLDFEVFFELYRDLITRRGTG